MHLLLAAARFSFVPYAPYAHTFTARAMALAGTYTKSVPASVLPNLLKKERKKEKTLSSSFSLRRDLCPIYLCVRYNNAVVLASQPAK